VVFSVRSVMFLVILFWVRVAGWWWVGVVGGGGGGRGRDIV
jgi:hypothetical protein